MAVAAVSHHSAERPGLRNAPRGQSTATACGRRPGVLEDPGPPLVGVERAAFPRSGAPSLAPPSLSAPADDGVDSVALSFLLERALSAKKEEEMKVMKEAEEKAAKEAEEKSLWWWRRRRR